MSLSEFELIERFFTGVGAERADVALGVGDDAALVRVPDGYQVVSALATLIEGTHFDSGTDAALIGERAATEALDRLTALRAEPAWLTLGLSLPEGDEAWLAGFASGLAAAAQRSGVALVGGDTTRGPRCVTVVANGIAPQNREHAA